MQKDGITRRIPSEEVEQSLIAGWIMGRPAPSALTREKQSESGKRAANPGHWKVGQVGWNLGMKMSDSVRLSISARQLSKHGVTREQIEEAWANDKRWCSEHLIFEPTENFAVLQGDKQSTRCKMSHKKHSPWFREKLESQHGVCALCDGQSVNDRALCVDHSHDCPNPKHTRKNAPLLGCECSRGLLCHHCNIRIEEVETFMSQGSGFTANPGTWLEKALLYLASYPLTSVLDSKQESQDAR